MGAAATCHLLSLGLLKSPGPLGPPEASEEGRPSPPGPGPGRRRARRAGVPSERTQTSDVVIFFNARPPEVPTPSLGPVLHPESFFDAPGALRGPVDADNSGKPPS